MSLGWVFDPNNYSQEHVLDFVKLYNKDMITPLEMACREARSLSPDDRGKSAMIMDLISAAPESVQDDLRYAVAALYLPRLTNMIRTINHRIIRADGESDANVERMLMVLFFLFDLEDSITCSPYLWTFLLDPQNAAIWTTFMALHIGDRLAMGKYQPTIPACVTLLQELILVLKPIRSGTPGGDGLTCLPHAHRVALHKALRKFLKNEASAANLPPNVKGVLADFCVFLDRVASRGRAEWREGHAAAMFGLPKCTVCEWAPAKAVCGRCQCFRYCSRQCQRLDWYSQNGHRIRCFETNYRGIKLSESGGGSTGAN